MSHSKPNRSGRTSPTIVSNLRIPTEVDLFFLANQDVLLEDIPHVELTTQAAQAFFWLNVDSQ
ncbi:CLUMA_CG020084, isoform A [Clunio marinus]|uniref:CLUMA_CG020084, isoform A n=1 Tax=Clunio marinus TaxID=568069 RepID=A0A1J1J3R2_9DIPT|nr:CLUMA_CG020084, isoform A [Clunio marinus]